MPQLVRRILAWLWIPLLVMVLIGVGLGLQWLWSLSRPDAGDRSAPVEPPLTTMWHRWARKGPDQVVRSAAAYALRDWNRAANLARQRLKTAPEDVEALRLLARATARLGRDAPANALFARLGSAALQAEDLYLLGLGLDRAGQKEEAGRVWEKALGLQPDHPETIEKLILHQTSRNRLAQAAQLAERLARQPGWELRGELDWGALRAELSDPAGAATTLRRALERPEAARLDRPARTRYRKLLARTLLQTGRPAEGHTVLTTVLEGGPDPEASWLLSRAALQQGAVPEATAALQSAGSYRAQHPLESEPSPFVGAARCAACHREIVRAVQASRHASTLVRGQSLLELPYPDHPLPDPDDPAVTHTFRRESGQVRVETRVKDRVLHAVLIYAFGSPDHYVSPIGRDDRGQSYILRLSHYDTGRDSGWVRTTGHSADAGGGSDFLGKPLDILDGIQKCLFCHSTNPGAVLHDSGPEAADRGIGCERCHGPGGNHLAAIAAQFSDPAIVSPAAAPAGGRIRVCGQCHSFHQDVSLPRTDPFWIRFQGTTLPWSRCFTESAGSLDCMTCHDPHHDTDRSPAHYNARCLTCHAAGTGSPLQASGTRADRAARGATCPVSPASGCVGCHMPPFESQPLHTTFTDHYIRVHQK